MTKAAHAIVHACLQNITINPFTIIYACVSLFLFMQVLSIHCQAHIHNCCVTSQRGNLCGQAQVHLEGLQRKADGKLGPADVQEMKQRMLEMAAFLQTSAAELQ